MPGSPAPRPPAAPTLADVRDAAWLAHRYDPGRDAVHLTYVPRATHRRVIFLTDEYLPAGLPSAVVGRREAVGAAPPSAPLHLLLHSAFCCSTLLARAFDLPGHASVLKEPVILNDLVGWRRRGGEGADMADVLEGVLTLLARPFGQGEAMVVKPSNAVNGIAAAMLALRPTARAVLLHAPLRTFLGSVAKKGLDGRLWVRTLLLGQLDDGLVDLGFAPRDYLGLSDLQVAAVGWLAQQALFARLIDRFGATRLRSLNSETLTTAPAETIAALAGLFQLSLDAATVDSIVTGPVFTRHSKLDAHFAVGDRVREHRDAANLHADEITKVAHWAEVVAERAGVTLVLPAPLLAAPTR